MVSGSNVTSVWIGPIPNTALYGIDINEWIDFISTVLGGKKGRYPSNLLKEDIDKWMLIDLPKGVDSIISREEYQGVKGQCCLSPEWTLGILSLCLARTTGGSEYEQSTLAYSPEPTIDWKGNFLYHFDLTQSILLLQSVKINK